MNTLQAIIIAVVEGLTEFLPISSTAHMAITSAIMGIGDDAFTKLFEIVIQFGAILSVIVLFWKKFFDFKNVRFYIKLVIAVIPALVFGALFKKHIEQVLGSPLVIATIMLLGGIVLLFVDKWFHRPLINEEENITYKQSFMIGVFQTLAIVFPGLSRSAATIVGGMQQRLSRRLAAEFSFFLAVPTMLAATVKSLYDVYKESPEVLGAHNMNILLTGCAVAFVVAMLAVKFFISFLQKHGFRLFGYYRIAAGIVLLILIYSGYIHR
jgi:undecaprenyl-diphosphatase